MLPRGEKQHVIEWQISYRNFRPEMVAAKTNVLNALLVVALLRRCSKLHSLQVHLKIHTFSSPCSLSRRKSSGLSQSYTIHNISKFETYDLRINFVYTWLNLKISGLKEAVPQRPKLF